MQELGLDFNNDKRADRYLDMLFRLPFSFDWVEYKGETVFAKSNYQSTVKAKKPMVDICYCATEALNDNVLFVAQYDKSKFKPSKLSMAYGQTD